MGFRGLSGFACGNCLARLPEALYNEGTVFRVFGFNPETPSKSANGYYWGS